LNEGDKRHLNNHVPYLQTSSEIDTIFGWQSEEESGLFSLLFIPNIVIGSVIVDKQAECECESQSGWKLVGMFHSKLSKIIG
jgi:hypothetical protein